MNYPAPSIQSAPQGGPVYQNKASDLETIQNSEYTDFNREKAAGLLSKGISPSQVALAIGVTPAVISQYLADPIFAAKVSGARQASLESTINREETANKLEDALLEKIKVLVPGEFKLGAILNAYKVLNGRKRLTDPSGSIDSGSGAPVVTLNLPQQAVNVFVQKDTNGQVISIGQQTLVTMQSQNLDIMASHQRNQEKQHAIPSLPSPGTFDFG